MSCSINISSVTGVTSGPNTNINIVGTVAGCTANLIVVTVTCGLNTYTQNVNVPGGQINWSTTVVTQCACNGPMTVIAACPSAGCSTTFNVSNLPCCCPTINITHTESPVCVTDPNCPNGGRQITFHVTGTLPPGCSSTNIQINYGDSSLSQVHNVTSSPFSFMDTHVYCAGGPPYSGVVYATSPVGCPGTPFSVSPAACPPCATNFWIKLLCGLIEFLMLVFAAVGFTCFTVPTCPGTSILGNLSIALAGLLYGVYTQNSTLNCLNCACFPYLKWIGIATLATGLCLVGFLADTCIPTLQTWIPWVTIGAGFILILIWYLVYRKICPLTICHFFRTLLFSVLVALGAFGILYAALNSIMANASVTLALAIMLISLFVIPFIIAYYKNHGHCVNYP